MHSGPCDLIHGSTHPVEKRLSTISIIVARQIAPVAAVNELVSQFSDEIIGRLGLPYPERSVNIITQITDTSVERLSALTGKLGKLPASRSDPGGQDPRTRSCPPRSAPL